MEATYLCGACEAQFAIIIAAMPGPGIVGCESCGRTTARRLTVPDTLVGGCVRRPACGAGHDLDGVVATSSPTCAPGRERLL